MDEPAPQLPLVSVVLGIYNQEKYVRKAIESILSQTYKNIEIIITNNGSTDNSAEIVNEYRSNPRIKAVISNEQNISLSVTANRAIRHASGEYVCFIAGDDYYLPGYIETHLKELSGLPESVGIVYSPYYVHNELSGEMFLEKTFDKSGDVFDSLIRAQLTNFISAFTPFMRRSLFDHLEYDEREFCEGEAFFIRVARKYEFKYIHAPLYVATDHSFNQGKNYKENSEHFLNACHKQIQLYPEKKSVIIRIISLMFVRNAWIAIRIIGDRDWARKCMAIAVRHKLYSLLHYRMIAALLLLHFPKQFVDLIFSFRKKSSRSALYIDEDYAGRSRGKSVPGRSPSYSDEQRRSCQP